jgi:hypothetical protein
LIDKGLEKAYESILSVLLGVEDHVQKEKLGKYNYYVGIKEEKLHEKNFKEFMQGIGAWIVQNKESNAKDIEKFRAYISEHKKRKSDARAANSIALIQQASVFLQDSFTQKDMQEYFQGEKPMIPDELFMKNINAMVWYITNLSDHAHKLLKYFQEDVGEKKYKEYVDKQRLPAGYHEIK